MNKIIALTLLGSTLLLSAPALAVDTNISSLCGPEGPEAYKRPGGYCEQIGANDSLNQHEEREYWWPSIE